MGSFCELWFLTIIIFLNLGLGNAYSVQPDVFVQSTVNRASQVLSNNLSKDQKIIELKSIAAETVDIKGIGFYTLGSIRKTLSDEQKNTYEDLFKNYFLKSFLNGLALPVLQLAKWTYQPCVLF